MKYRTKKNIIYVLSSALIFVFVIGMILVVNISKGYESGYLKQTGYVYNILNKLVIPVDDENYTKIIRPYKDTNMKIVKKYYDYKKPAEEQEDALIFFEDTYMQSTGVAYSNGEKFNVLAVYDGKVEKVVNDEFIGNSITIKHDGFKSIYQSLSEIDVKEGDYVSKGTIIGISGTSNINSSLENHLFFELIINDENVNPEEYYDKEL